MKGPARENELSKGAKEMTGAIPSQYDNNNYGKKRTARAHKFTVKDTKTGKKYWIPAVMEAQSFTDFLIAENTQAKLDDKVTTLPEIVIGELKKLIAKGAKDLAQNWKDAGELVNTAYHVANIRRPIPDQRGAWKQYEDLLKYGVHQLWDSRGKAAPWRASSVIHSESQTHIGDILAEAAMPSRFFVKIPGAADIEINIDDHPDIKTIGDVVNMLSHRIRRQGGRLQVERMTEEGAVCRVFVKNEPREEIIVQSVS